jgi:hypothetical protein
MDPILIDAAQLRTLRIPGLALTPGRVIMARVAGIGEDARGQLAIAGGRITAALPPGVRTGDELRLVVKDLSAERVVLQIQAEAPAPAPASPQAPRQGDGEGETGGGETTTPTHLLRLSYQTQNLGPVGLRFELHPAGALSVRVEIASAVGLARAKRSADGLRAALVRASSGQVDVAVGTPRPPLDLYV